MSSAALSGGASLWSVTAVSNNGVSLSQHAESRSAHARLEELLVIRGPALNLGNAVGGAGNPAVVAEESTDRLYSEMLPNKRMQLAGASGLRNVG